VNSPDVTQPPCWQRYPARGRRGLCLTISVVAFLTIALVSFTYSSTNGIGAGFVSWLVIEFFTGKAKEINWLMWVVSLAFVLCFGIYPIEVRLGVK
jgi:AGZA family xanthine/uracil permease-like MFS transporter